MAIELKNTNNELENNSLESNNANNGILGSDVLTNNNGGSLDLSSSVKLEQPAMTDDRSGMKMESQQSVVKGPELDPNAIKIELPKNDVPIVVLFGPPSCGKTMTLVRLTRYIQFAGYQVSPVRNFRPQEKHYEEMCDKFRELVNSNDAAQGTDRISFMLVRISKEVGGDAICYLLEAPGENYFLPSDPNEPNKPFPPYVMEIINSRNRKVWCYILEHDWNQNSLVKNNYAAKIKTIRRRKGDKNIFVYNKVDKFSGAELSLGKVNMKVVRRQIESDYQNIFECPDFVEKGIIFKSENFKIVGFSTGSYNVKKDGGEQYTQGPDEYPKELWNAILGYIKG